MPWVVDAPSLDGDRRGNRDHLQGGAPKLPPGSIVASLAELAGTTSNRGIQVTRRNLEFLEMRRSISRESGSQGTIITLQNWAEYQCRPISAADVPADERQTSGRRAADQRQLIEEVRIKKEEEERKEPTLAEQTKGCVEEWGRTLAHFKIPRDPALDEIEILRLIQRYTQNRVRDALAGARFEQGFDGWNPVDHLSMARIKKADTFAKLEILGSRGLARINTPDPVDLQRADDLKRDEAAYDRIRASIGESSGGNRERA
jgi:hypothetical protein